MKVSEVIGIAYLSVFASSAMGSPLRAEQHVLTEPDFEIIDPFINDTFVGLDYGRFRGETVSGIHHFFGIPFAAPPVGPLRFRPPQPPLPMAPGATLNVTKHGPSCMQLSSRTSAGTQAVIDEDCLTLDIWIPEKPVSKGRLPVMVWIYGGAFVRGGSSDMFYDGDAMIKANDAPMIFVSVNYRLNAFGFLGSQTLLEQGSTNLGLLDQVAALEWVRKYIHHFGGDPEYVTASGESAGAISIGAHLLAHNGHQKLFQKAILQSGTALQVFPAILDSQAVFDKLLNATKCSQARDTIGCLQQVPAEILLNATASDSFSIVMDGVYVQRQPVESYLRELFSRVPLLIGTNTDEGTYFTYNAVKSTEDIDKYYDATVPFLNGTQRSQLMQLYPSSSYSAPYLAAADVTGDRLFQCPSKLMARVYADAGLRVFKYHWNYPVTPPPPFNGNVSLGVFHFSEVPFVFNIQSLFRTPEEFNLSRILNAFWIQFVVQGNPNPRQEPFDGLNDQLWPLYNAFSGYQQIVFQAPVEAITLEEDRSREEKCLFWDLVGQSLMYSKTTSTRS